MDILWLVIPAAILLFVVRTIMIARSLKTAAGNPTLANVRALHTAKRDLKVHRTLLHDVVAQPKGHLDAAKRMAAVPKPRATKRAYREVAVEDAAAQRDA
ncbi:MAG: hypothetical protein L3J78_04605 [Thermoplasmata archaeon]|nr:hypothetical protein [Thermoplasmata archaeon]